MSQLNPDHILQTGFAFWASKTLLSAIEMGLFTELAQGPLASEALRTRLKLHPRSRAGLLRRTRRHGLPDADWRHLRQHA